jgi:hypothetical protein
MLIASFIFVLSVAAFIQFGALQWRASVIRESSTSGAGSWMDKSLAEVCAFQKLCPDLGGIPNLRPVRVYHSLLQVFARMGATEWAKREMEICGRYAAVILMQQVERNQALAAEASSF